MILRVRPPTNFRLRRARHLVTGVVTGGNGSNRVNFIFWGPGPGPSDRAGGGTYRDINIVRPWVVCAARARKGACNRRNPRNTRRITQTCNDPQNRGAGRRLPRIRVQWGSDSRKYRGHSGLAPVWASETRKPKGHRRGLHTHTHAMVTESTHNTPAHTACLD